MDTDPEPSPRDLATAPPRMLPDWPAATNWPRQVLAPEMDFLAVLGARRSNLGDTVSEFELASVLRHSTMLRSRRSDGRFGTWESRASAAAGGLHAIALLVLPLVGDGPGGIYDPDRHALLSPPSIAEAVHVNRDNISMLLGSTGGATLQFVADRSRYNACYKNAASLIWRDAGGLAAVITLVATALSLRSVIIGRHGNPVVRAAGFTENWVGVGGVHLGS